MKKTQRESQKGFTLIEVIVTLVLVGIISLFAGAAVVSAVQGFVMVRENAEASQKVHVAMNRMTHDLQLASNIVSGTSQRIEFDTVLVSGVPTPVILEWAGGNSPVMLNEQILVDAVTSFQIFYYDGSSEVPGTSYSAASRGVEIRLQRQGVNVLYVERVFPRNIPQNRGML